MKRRQMNGKDGFEEVDAETESGDGQRFEKIDFACAGERFRILLGENRDEPEDEA